VPVRGEWVERHVRDQARARHRLAQLAQRAVSTSS
jgi:hypothetical protein